MSLFTRFANEAAFRDDFIKPLLNRLGFYGVEQQHGAQEFGKDFVFSELHRLGGWRHYAAQVKHSQKIHQGKEVDELLTQIKQCFSMPFHRADSPRPCHVSSVYVFNSGKITSFAKQQLLAELTTEKYGDNVHFLAGERLEAIAQSAAYSIDRDVRARLGGLFMQLSQNKNIALSYAAQLTNDGTKYREGRGFMFAGIEGYLSSPIVEANLPLADLYAVWDFCRAIETSGRALFVLAMPETKKAHMEAMEKMAADLLPRIEAVQQAIKLALERFKPLI